MEILAFGILVVLLLVALAVCTCVKILAEIRGRLTSVRNRMDGEFDTRISGVVNVKGNWEEDDDDWWKHGKPKD